MEAEGDSLKPKVIEIDEEGQYIVNAEGGNHIGPDYTFDTPGNVSETGKAPLEVDYGNGITDGQFDTVAPPPGTTIILDAKGGNGFKDDSNSWSLKAPDKTDPEPLSVSATGDGTTVKNGDNSLELIAPPTADTSLLVKAGLSEDSEVRINGDHLELWGINEDGEGNQVGTLLFSA